MISASKARDLQKQGISQDEHLQNAIARADAAVKEMSRKGHSFVLVAFYFLSQESFDKLVAHLIEYGYECECCSWAGRNSKITIRWAPDAQAIAGATQ